MNIISDNCKHKASICSPTHEGQLISEWNLSVTVSCVYKFVMFIYMIIEIRTMHISIDNQCSIMNVM